MKKILSFIFLFFTSILVTNAAPCKVISGDGTHIGDEIQCGTENFYVLSNDGENIEMLAKYNLYVGRTYYKVELGQTFENWNEANNYWEENYANEYDGYERFVANEDNQYYVALAYKELEYDEVKQSEEAIGAHGNLKVEPLFPEQAVYVYDDNLWDYYMDSAYYTDPYYSGYQDFDIDINSTDPAELLDYLIEYNDYLNNLEITTTNISILSVKEINDIVYQVSGKELPLEEWWNNSDTWGKLGFHYDALVVGSIKDLMPEGYEWLWSTTYWTRTIPAHDIYNLYFIDTMGDLCNGDFCQTSLGAGIRPVVTIPAYLIYQIETKTDGNGTVEADHIEAEGGTEVKFTVTPNEGYVLSEVKVTDANGNVVIFTDYTFTMPNANVLIEATFVPIPKKENPDTSDIIAIACTILVISGILLTFTNNKKKSLR